MLPLNNITSDFKQFVYRLHNDSGYLSFWRDVVLIVFERQQTPHILTLVSLKSIFRCKGMWFVFYNAIKFFVFSVPEILDRKYFHKEGVCVYYTEFKRPPQVNEKWWRNSLLLFEIEKVSIMRSVGLCFCMKYWPGFVPSWLDVVILWIDWVLLFLKVLWHCRNLKKMFPCSLCSFLAVLLLMSVICLQWGGVEKKISEVSLIELSSTGI